MDGVGSSLRMLTLTLSTMVLYVELSDLQASRQDVSAVYDVFDLMKVRTLPNVGIHLSLTAYSASHPLSLKTR